jgi:hypothetical protein
MVIFQTTINKLAPVRPLARAGGELRNYLPYGQLTIHSSSNAAGTSPRKRDGLWNISP